MLDLTTVEDLGGHVTRVFILAIAASFSASSAFAGTITGTSTPGLAILPDNGCAVDGDAGLGAGGVSDTIAIAQAGTISDVNVQVAFTHTWRSDLQMILSYTGGGGNVRLANGDGNSANSDNFFATFDTDAATLCSDATLCGSTAAGGGPCQTSPGPTCQPDQPLTAFNTLASPGTWTLTICDRVAQDLGTLDSWSVTLDGQGLPVELMNFSVD